jgi:hypothetical protein
MINAPYDRHWHLLSRLEKIRATFFFLRCLIFHRKYRKRTGERRIHQISIVYETKCQKCGCEDISDVWFNL